MTYVNGVASHGHAYLDPQTGAIRPEYHKKLNRSTALVKELRARPDQIKYTKGSGAPAISDYLSAGERAQLGYDYNLADNTFRAPRGAKEIEKFIDDVIKPGGFVVEGGPKDAPTLIGIQSVSASMLGQIHPGSTDHARHLHPSQLGLDTGSADDWNKVRLIWRYKPTRPGRMHPDPIQLTDGSLAAAWLIKDEKGVDMKRLFEHEARSQDFLAGNRHAFDKTAFMRLYHGVMYRFGSYGVGIGEGLSNPRYNGAIAANLIVTGLTISSALYMLFYGIDYQITMKEMPKHPHKKAHHPPAPPAVDSDSAGTVVLGSSPSSVTASQAAAVVDAGPQAQQTF